MPGERHLHGCKGASSEFRLNWVVWETDLTPQAVNPCAGGSQFRHLLTQTKHLSLSGGTFCSPCCLRECCVVKSTWFITYIIQKSGL